MFFSFICFTFFVAVLAEEECHQWSKSYPHYLSTKTPYRVVANLNDSKLSFSGCQPTKIWMMVRHGTRYPGAELINNVNNVLYKIRDDIVSGFEEGTNTLCEEVAKRFASWSPNLDMSKKKHLAHEGEEEMIGLAERFQRRLPELFPEVYSSAFKVSKIGN